MSKLMFKNAAVFRLLPDAVALESLNEMLAREAFQSCGAETPESYGWIETVAGAGLAGCQVDGQVLVTLKVESKVVPGSALKAEVEKRVAEIAEKEGRKVGRKEKKEITEVVLAGLLLRALPSFKQVRAWIDTRDHWVVVDSSSTKITDMVLSTLIKSLDKAPCKVLGTNVSPSAAMADWLSSDEAPANFSVDMDCSLKGTEGQTVRFAKHSLDGQVAQHLAEGKVPVALGMTFSDRASFVLTDGGQFKKMSFVDAILDAHQENCKDCESQEAAAIADLVFMGGELRGLLPAVIEALGGERNEDNTEPVRDAMAI